MRGIVFDGTKTEFVDGLSLRAPGPRDVIVEIAAAGLCHSDISYMSGLYPVPSPGVCGHEGAGIVAQVGNAVTHVKPGDHVIIATLAACGFCDRCNVPSRTDVTPSRRPIESSAVSAVRAVTASVRGTTRTPRSAPNALVTSSVRPSAR